MTLDKNLKYLLGNSRSWKILGNPVLLKQNTYSYLNIFLYLEVVFSFEKQKDCRKWSPHWFSLNPKAPSKHKQLQGVLGLWGILRPDLFLRSSWVFFFISNLTTLQTSSDGCLFVSSIQGMQCENHNPPYAERKLLMRTTLWGCKLWYGDIVYKSWKKGRWKYLDVIFHFSSLRFCGQVKTKTHSSIVSHIYSDTIHEFQATECRNKCCRFMFQALNKATPCTVTANTPCSTDVWQVSYYIPVPIMRWN